MTSDAGPSLGSRVFSRLSFAVRDITIVEDTPAADLQTSLPAEHQAAAAAAAGQCEWERASFLLLFCCNDAPHLSIVKSSPSHIFEI